MLSILDHPVISRKVFFPRPDFSPPPPAAHDVMLEVERGVRLHARVHDAPGAVAVVVLFHGNGEVVSDYDVAAPRFARAGAALAVVDFRGYGRSEGEPGLRHLVGDARPALDGLLRHLAQAGDSRRVVVMGRSLGSACAVEVAPAVPQIVAGVVFESGFSDLTALARRRGVIVERIAEENLVVLCPLRKLARSPTPLLVLHGAEDTLIVPAEGRAAFEASRAEDKRFVLIPGCGHNTVSHHPLYWEELAAFLRRVASTDHPEG
jgi:alpha-beta hydrolase superfamily lysophospholipase